MFKYILLLFLTFGASANSCPFFYCKGSDSLGVQRLSVAREYELNHKVEDEIKSLDYFVFFKFKRNFYLNNLYYQIDIPTYAGGEYVEFYAPNNKTRHDKKFLVESLKEPTIHIEYWFNHAMSSNFYHALDVSYTPKIYRPTVYQFGNGRHEVKLNYHYLTLYDKYFFEGNIYAKVFGRKKLELSDKTIEFTPAYTEVVTSFGLGYYFEKWKTSLLVGYGQTTNYSNKSQNLTHESDKGFVLLYNFKASYVLSKDTSVALEYEAFSKIFNTINEDLSKDIDFENETSNLQIMLVRTF